MTEISRIKGIHLGGFELHSKNAIAAAPDKHKSHSNKLHHDWSTHRWATEVVFSEVIRLSQRVHRRFIVS
jgi:hypothetical protein